MSNVGSRPITGFFVFAVVMLLAIKFGHAVVRTIHERDQYRAAWVATMSVVTDIANIPSEQNPRLDQVYPDENGCAVITVKVDSGTTVTLSHRYSVCPGGDVMRGDTERYRTHNAGYDDFWANLGHPEAKAKK